MIYTLEDLWNVVLSMQFYGEYVCERFTFITFPAGDTTALKIFHSDVLILTVWFTRMDSSIDPDDPCVAVVEWQYTYPGLPGLIPEGFLCLDKKINETLWHPSRSTSVNIARVINAFVSQMTEW